ncbi:hypothetical protein BT96DRAFT_921967 [Gymnopus androsaceus JB14]|uniref:F-box domain-containing protein n=1 Tax=Gymnopus androsaceus JB14 TaxID=1447944 RepID=A0A6A4HFZ5_9AGAR|nr:hypothetical protein BT96DRAFT_921967 [Gymnopus androsaceus JB14]
MPSQLPNISDRLRGRYPFNKWEVSEILRDIDGNIKATSAEILRMQSDILALRMKREKLEKLGEECLSLMAPIRKLPTELLDHIFEFCCCDEASDFFPFANDLVDAPTFTLSSVCAQWREIILPNPKFWANLSLHLDPSMGEKYDMQTPVGLHLLRSKQYPLTLQIHLVSHEHPLLPTLIEHSQRWKSVSFHCFHFSERFWPSLTSLGQLTILKHLEIDSRRIPHLYLVQEAPSLRSLSLTYVPSSQLSGKFPWKQITHLELNAVHSGSVFRALESCPNLHSVFYRNIYCRSSESAHGIVNQKSAVRSVSICVSGIAKDAGCNLLNQLVSSFTLPRLEVLSLQTSISAHFYDLSRPRSLFTEWADTRPWCGNYSLGEWPRHAFDMFLDRSGCTLTTLQLEMIPISDLDAIHLLECLPSLENLLIREQGSDKRTISSQFLKSSCQRLSSSQVEGQPEPTSVKATGAWYLEHGIY